MKLSKLIPFTEDDSQEFAGIGSFDTDKCPPLIARNGRFTVVVYEAGLFVVDTASDTSWHYDCDYAAGKTIALLMDIRPESGFVAIKGEQFEVLGFTQN